MGPHRLGFPSSAYPCTLLAGRRGAGLPRLRGSNATRVAIRAAAGCQSGGSLCGRVQWRVSKGSGAMVGGGGFAMAGGAGAPTSGEATITHVGQVAWFCGGGPSRLPEPLECEPRANRTRRHRAHPTGHFLGE